MSSGGGVDEEWRAVLRNQTGEAQHLPSREEMRDRLDAPRPHASQLPALLESARGHPRATDDDRAYFDTIEKSMGMMVIGADMLREDVYIAFEDVEKRPGSAKSSARFLKRVFLQALKMGVGAAVLVVYAQRAIGFLDRGVPVPWTDDMYFAWGPK